MRSILNKTKKKPSETVIPPRPPWEIAYESLKKLAEENLVSQGMIKEFYIRLSNIVRYYIENRFSVKAPDMTTEEFLFSLKGADWLSASQKEALKGFLNCCDMVKFAKYASHDQEIQESFALAKRLVDETVETPAGT